MSTKKPKKEDVRVFQPGIQQTDKVIQQNSATPQHQKFPQYSQQFSAEQFAQQSILQQQQSQQPYLSQTQFQPYTQVFNESPELQVVKGFGLLNQASNYFQGGQSYFKQQMRTDMFRYYFNLNNSYIKQKVLLLVTPYLRNWDYSRVQEQIQEGNRYKPPREDVNAPDLYIPLMSIATYCFLISLQTHLHGKFSPIVASSKFTGGFFAWGINFVIFFGLFNTLSIKVPYMEVLAFAGYPFYYVSIIVIIKLLFGLLGGYITWLYCGICLSWFLVKSIKRTRIQEDQYNIQNEKNFNLIILVIPFIQFPTIWFLSLFQGWI